MAVKLSLAGTDLKIGYGSLLNNKALLKLLCAGFHIWD